MISVKVESVFEHGMVVSYTDRSTGVVYYGALLPQDKDAVNSLPPLRKRSSLKIPRVRLVSGTVNVTKKPSVEGLKQNRKRKQHTSVVDLSDKALNPCVIVCDDPYVCDTPEGKYHRYSKSKAYQKIKEDVRAHFNEDGRNIKRRKLYQTQKKKSKYNVKSNQTSSKRNIRMESSTNYQDSSTSDRFDHYCGIQSLELVNLKQVHTAMKSFSLTVSKVKLPT